MGVSTYDGTMADNPFVGIVNNQRMWYDPVLREQWVNKVLYSQFATMEFDTRGLPTVDSMEVTSLILPHPDFSPIGLRQLYMDASRTDSQSRTVSIDRYAAKMAFHEHDQQISYWRTLGKMDAIRALCDAGLGHMMTEINENLVRNAYLSAPFTLHGSGGPTDTDFSHIIEYGDRLSTQLVKDIQLGMMTRGVPFTQTGQNNGSLPAKLICLTTPGVVQDLKGEASASGNGDEFIDVMKYNSATRIYTGELGTYQDVRFIASPRAFLYNCGNITKRASIVASHNAGDGVNRATKVDKTWKVGQKSGITNYIQLDDASGLKVGDYISLHLSRTNDFGVTTNGGGADYREGTKQERRVVAVDTGTDRIVLDLPIMTDFNVDLGGGVYGYVTLGRHIHTSLFIGGFDGVVQAVHQPPRIHNPPPGDDFESIHRFSFDMYTGYNLWSPQVIEAHFGAGSFRWSGPAIR